MKKNRILSLVLAIAVAAGATGVTAFALTSASPAPQADEAAAAPSVGDLDTASAQGLSKDETVYVISAPDGSVQKVIVTDQIKNPDGLSAISDESALTDIETVKGDASYTASGSSLQWDTAGGDVSYRGNLEKDLPVTMKVTYTLDGKEIAPDTLAGQSGRVTIRYTYTNRQYEVVTINGKEEKIYVPFAVLTGLLLDSDHFTNVSVTNGKLLEDGNRTAVVGLSLPGLQEDLGLSRDQVDLPDFVEITADVTDFSLDTSVAVITNSVFNDLDDDLTGELDLSQLQSSLDKLTSAVTQLTDGSSALYQGLCTLLDKTGDLTAGVQQLSAGLSTLSSNSAQLNSGARQVFESLLAQANTQLKASGLSIPELTVENYNAVLTDLLTQLDEPGTYAENAARQQFTAAVRAQEETIRTAVTAAVRQQVEPQVTAAIQSKVTEQVIAAVQAQVQEKVLAQLGLTAQQYEASLAAGLIPEAQQAQITAAVEQQMNSDSVKALISKTVSEKMSSDEVTALVESTLMEKMSSTEVTSLIDQKTEEQIDLLVQQQMAAPEVQQKILEATQTASAGAAGIRSLKQQLDSYNAFYTGLLTYTAGVDSAASGAALLQGSMPALTDGVTQLRDGALQLSDGMKQFEEEGIEKLTSALNGDLGSVGDRLRATIQVSKRYQSFSGLADDMTGSVKFIYRTDSISAPAPTETDAE